MSVHVRASSITLINVTRWESGIALFGFDRCIPFFGEMGLPKEVVAEPAGIINASRSYFESSESAALATMGNLDNAMDELRARVDAYFENVAVAYDCNAARSLVAWYGRYILGDSFSNAALSLRDIFRHMCNWTTDEWIFSPPPLGGDTRSRVCGVVAPHLSPEALSSVNDLVRGARAMPRTDREEYLEQRFRWAAGQAFGLNATDMAVDLIARIITDHRTLQAWRELTRQLSDAERVRFANWARQISGTVLPEGALTEHPLQWD